MGINTGALYIIFIMFALFGFAYVVSGPTPEETPVPVGPEVALVNGSNGGDRANLQLYNFGGITITPPANSLCEGGGLNIDPDALIGFSPDQATGVSSNGQIKLWVSDTLPPYISPGEQVIKSSGSIKEAGDLATRAPDGYLLEPQLYIFPQTVDRNGKPYFPDFVRGNYNNGNVGVSYGSDPAPADALPLSLYTVEFVWNVSEIGLTDGDYQIQFVIHDGHEKLGVRCASLYVYTPSESENPTNKLPL
jgi:hypothetical protein